MSTIYCLCLVSTIASLCYIICDFSKTNKQPTAGAWFVWTKKIYKKKKKKTNSYACRPIPQILQCCKSTSESTVLNLYIFAIPVITNQLFGWKALKFEAIDTRIAQFYKDISPWRSLQNTYIGFHGWTGWVYFKIYTYLLSYWLHLDPALEPLRCKMFDHAKCKWRGR